VASWCFLVALVLAVALVAWCWRCFLVGFLRAGAGAGLLDRPLKKS
jgi:hypothetical protein